MRGFPQQGSMTAGAGVPDSSSSDGFTSSSANGIQTGDTGSATLAQAVGFLNILVGLMLVAAILFFVGGFMGWITRLGLTGRDQGLKFMSWGVSILFVLVVGLALIRFVQFHTQLVLTLLAVALVALAAYVAIQVAKSSGETEDAKH